MQNYDIYKVIQVVPLSVLYLGEGGGTDYCSNHISMCWNMW